MLTEHRPSLVLSTPILAHHVRDPGPKLPIRGAAACSAALVTLLGGFFPFPFSGFLTILRAWRCRVGPTGRKRFETKQSVNQRSPPSDLGVHSPRGWLGAERMGSRLGVVLDRKRNDSVMRGRLGPEELEKAWERNQDCRRQQAHHEMRTSSCRHRPPGEWESLVYRPWPVGTLADATAVSPWHGDLAVASAACGEEETTGAR